MRPVDLPMFSLPIIWREMRSESRRSTTHWLRLLGALVTTGSALLFIANTYPGSAMRGDQLFYVLNRFLFISLWLVGPVLTADCISQEKRDGTLGLLFLTGLTPSGIASGKGTVHLLRGFTFLIAVAPVLSLPLLLGGVSRADLGMALMLNVAALSWGLSAGLIASSFCRDWIRALLLGELLSLCFAGLFTIVHTEILEWIALTYAGGGGIVWAPQGQSPWTTLLLERLWRVPLLDLTPFLLAVNSGGNGWHMDRACWPTIWSTWPPVAQLTWIHAAALLSACSIMSVPASIALAAARIRRSWTDQPASARQLWILDRFCTPRFWRSVSGAG